MDLESVRPFMIMPATAVLNAAEMPELVILKEESLRDHFYSQLFLMSGINSMYPLLI